MLLMIDNYDSFTYNLVQYLGELGEDVRVFRNDEITVAKARELAPERVVVSPGPCTPNEAGVSCAIIEAFAGVVPVLGVCLGHQAIGQVFGGKVVRAPRVMHGKTSPIHHDGRTLYAGLANPFAATRYHSLVVAPETVPAVLEVASRTAEGEVMGLRHRELTVEGVQFHPESIMTDSGKQLLQNFVAQRGGKR